MYIPATATAYVFIPLDGPQHDLTGFAVSVALVADVSGAEPLTADYKPASWINGEVARLFSPGDYAAGEYMAWVRVVAAPEDIRLPCGRMRIGDVRT